MGQLRNAEFAGVSRQFLLLFVAAAAALCVLLALQGAAVHRGVVEQTAGAVGRLIELYPGNEREIVLAAAEPVSQETRARGREALAAWGYGPASAVDTDPVLGRLYPGLFAQQLLFLTACAGAAFLLLWRGYGRVYRLVRAFSVAAEQVVDGRADVQLPDTGEGEFAVLGHRFNQMANRLRLHMEQLTAEKVFLRNIISDISHQLKTPLATLVLYNDLMASDAAMAEAQRANFLELGRQQLQRLEWLIQSLLKMARLEAGSIAFLRKPVALRDVAEAARASLAATAGEAGVAVRVREHHAGAEYLGDEEWLAEALINILKNAVEHSRRGSAVDIILDGTPLTASVTVADRGEGIGEEELPHVFDRFYRGSRAVKPNSIGIGLAMAKAIVEGQGGTIAVKSEKGRGSEFTIVFLKTLGGGLPEPS